MYLDKGRGVITLVLLLGVLVVLLQYLLPFLAGSLKIAPATGLAAAIIAENGQSTDAIKEPANNPEANGNESYNENITSRGNETSIPENRTGDTGTTISPIPETRNETIENSMSPIRENQTETRENTTLPVPENQADASEKTVLPESNNSGVPRENQKASEPIPKPKPEVRIKNKNARQTIALTGELEIEARPDSDARGAGILSTEPSEVAHARISNLQSNISIRVDRPTEQQIKTAIFSVESAATFDSATLTLPKYGEVTTVLYCLSYDQNKSICPRWQATDIPFMQNSTHLTFTVTHFTAYAGGAPTYSSNLTIWDDTDPEGGSIQRNVSAPAFFYANYTNSTSGASIATGQCNITFSDSQSNNMPLSGSTFQYNRTFSSARIYPYNVTCADTSAIYNSLNATDSIIITDTPPSISFTDPTDQDNSYLSRNYSYVNVSVSDATNTTAFIDWNRSLVGWWRFNGEGGENSSFFRDWSSWANNASCSGSVCPNATAGMFGDALQFDGVNDYLNAGSGAALNITGERMAVEAWVYYAGGDIPTNQRVTVVSKYSSSNSFILDLPDDGGVEGYRFLADAASAKWNATPAANSWTHLVGVYNSTNLLLYVNGIERASAAKTGGISASNAALSVGSRLDGGPAYYFNGSIDEVRVWNRALSPEEVNASFNAGLFRLYRNFTGLAEGTYSYTAYAQDSAGNVNMTSRVVGVDLSAPALFNVQFSPFVDVDLGEAVVRANVSDFSGAEAVMMEHNSTGTPANYTMFLESGTNRSGVYNRTIAFSGLTTISFRIFVNDSFGRSNSTPNYSISVRNITASIILNSTYAGPSDPIRVTGQAFLQPGGSGLANNSISFWLDGGALGLLPATDSLSPEGWLYYKTITVNGSGQGNLSGYPVAVNVTYSQNMQPGFGDVRFAWYNQTSQSRVAVPYWIESRANGSWAYAWVKIPEIPANSTSTLYLYYGSPYAVDAGNGSAVFDFFDDFAGTSLDAAKWYSYGTMTVNNGITIGNAASEILGKTAVSSPIKMTAKVLRTGDVQFVGMTNQTSVTADCPSTCQPHASSANTLGIYPGNQYNKKAGTYAEIAYSGFGADTYTYTLYWDSGTPTFDIYKNGSYEQSIASQIPTVSLYPVFADYRATASALTVYYVYIRKYASPEPSVLSFGAQMPAVSTNSSGGYSYSFSAPLEAGNHAVKVNVTDSAGIYGENSASFVQQKIAVREQRALGVLTGTSRVLPGYELNVSALVYRSLGGNISAVWVNVTSPNGTNYTYRLAGAASANETGVWFLVLNVSSEFGDALGEYAVGFYANDTGGLASEAPAPQANFAVRNVSITEFFGAYVLNPYQSFPVWGETPAANATVYVILNATYGTGNVSSFNDSSTLKNMTFGSAGSVAAYVRLYKYLDVVSARFDVRGLFYNNSFPRNPSIDIGNNSDDDFWGAGTYVGTRFTQDRFSDNSPSRNISFYMPDYDLSNVTLPKSLSLVNATLNISGVPGFGFSDNESGNMIQNGGFENGTNWWSFFSVHSDTNATGIVKEGNYSTHFTSTLGTYSALWYDQAYFKSSVNNRKKFYAMWYYPLDLTASYVELPEFTLSQVSGPRVCYFRPLNTTAMLMSGTSGSSAYFANPFTSSRWYKIQLYCNPSLSEAILWVDGKKIANDTGPAYTDSYVGIWLGDPWAGSQGWGNAYIDGVSLTLDSVLFAPENVTLNVGNETVWSQPGVLNASNSPQSAGVFPAVSSYLDSCTASTDSRGNRYCNVPVNVTSAAAGNVSLAALNFSYDYAPAQLSSIYEDFRSAINNYLATCSGDESGYCNVPLVFRSDSAGIIEVSGINITYVADYLNKTATDSSGNYSLTVAAPGTPGGHDVSVFLFKYGGLVGNESENITVLANTSLSLVSTPTPVDVDAGLLLWADYRKLWGDLGDVNYTYSSLNVSIWNSTGGSVLDNASMAYNITSGRWEYSYNLSALGVLNYTAYASSWEVVNGQPVINKSASSSFEVQNVSIPAAAPKSAYAPEENLTVSGTVLLQPYGSAIVNNTISLYLDGTKLFFSPATGFVSAGGNESLRSDAAGNFSYTLKSPLEAGNHTILINATNSNGIFGQSSFQFVSSNIAVRNQSALSPQTLTSHSNPAQAIVISALVFKNLDNPIGAVWVNVSLPNLSIRTYTLVNGTSPYNTGVWSKTLNVSVEFGNLLGQYTVVFYANSTLANGSVVVQESAPASVLFYVQNISVSLGFGRYPAVFRPGENITVSGKVLLQPDGANITGNPVGYWLDGNMSDWCGGSGYSCIAGNGTYVQALGGTWRYLRQVTLNNSANPENLSQYQIPVNITYGAGMQPGFGDIRFSWFNHSSLQEVALPYWIENKSDGSWAYAWVRVPEIPASSYSSFYLYYGNGSAVNESNATATFVFFDDFEGGSLSGYELGGSLGWIIANDSKYQGAYSAGSDPAINDNQHSWMRRSFEGPVLIEFYNSVSSEGCCDYLRFSINGNAKGSIAGSVGWSRRNYTAGAGNQTLLWNYTKDSSVTTGSDRGWIDNLRLRRYSSPEPAAIMGQHQPATLTGGKGDYNYTLLAPLEEGAHAVKINVTDVNGIYGEAELSFLVDGTPPNISVESPLNSTYPASVWFNVSLSDGAAWCGYSLDGQANVTMSNDSATHFSNNTLVSGGAHEVVFFCNDTIGNMANSSATYFAVDSQPPAVGIQSPSGAIYATVTIPLNFTAFDSGGVDSCWFELVNSSGAFNLSLLGCQNVTLVGVAEGSNSVRVWANDSVGNWNSSALVSFTVDNVVPGVIVQSPSNVSYATGSIALNFTVWDAGGVDSCWYELTNSSGVSNVSLPNCLNATLAGLAEGSNGVRVWVNDTANNWNVSSSVSFTVDTLGPSINIQEPTSAVYATTEVGLNYTVWDAGGASSCAYQLTNSSGSYNFTLPNCLNATLAGLAEGSNSVRVWANDSLNNWNVSTTVSFVVDTHPPAWVEVPQGQNISYGSAFYYDVNGTDSGVGVDRYFINDTSNFRINSSSGVIENNTLLVLGPYLLNVSVNDTVNNINSTMITILVKDLNPPTWNETPSSQDVEYGAGFYYNLNASDNVAVDTFWVNDSTNFVINVFSGVVENKTFLGLGVWLLNVSVNDSSGNRNLSLFNVTVRDTRAPSWDQTPVNQVVEHGSAFYYELNASDLLLDKYWINDPTNFRINASTGVVQNSTLLGLGVYSLNVSVNDTSGNRNSSLFNVIVQDLLSPSIAIQVPSQGQTFSSFTVPLNFTTSDAGDISSCRYELQNSTGSFNVSISNCQNVSAMAGVTEGANSVKVWANDSVNNWNSSALVSFTVDTLPPALVFVSPTPYGQTIDISYVFVNVSSSEPLSSALLEWNGTNLTMSGSGSGRYLNLTSLARGNFSFRVFANDSAGNWNYSGAEWVLVNYTPVVKINFKLMNSSGGTVENASLVLYNSSGAFASVAFGYANSSFALNFSGGALGAKFSAPSGEVLRLTGISAGADADIRPQFVPYSGFLPENVLARSGAVALNDSGFSFALAEVGIPLSGPADRILHCADWSFSSASCSSWESKPSSDYNASGNSTWISFNVTFFDAYLAGYYSVPPPPRGGSAGGPGGGAPAIASPSKSRGLRIQPGEPLVFVEVNFREELAGASFKISGLSKLPVLPPEAPVYYYFNASTVNFNSSDIKSATVEFRVNKSWISGNDVASVYLAVYDGGWVGLGTVQVNSSKTQEVYRAYPRAFSYFAIAGVRAAAPPSTMPPVVAVLENASFPESFDETALPLDEVSITQEDIAAALMALNSIVPRSERARVVIQQARLRLTEAQFSLERNDTLAAKKSLDTGSALMREAAGMTSAAVTDKPETMTMFLGLLAVLLGAYAYYSRVPNLESHPCQRAGKGF